MRFSLPEDILLGKKLIFSAAWYVVPSFTLVPIEPYTTSSPFYKGRGHCFVVGGLPPEHYSIRGRSNFKNLVGQTTDLVLSTTSNKEIILKSKRFSP